MQHNLFAALAIAAIVAIGVPSQPNKRPEQKQGGTAESNPAVQAAHSDAKQNESCNDQPKTDTNSPTRNASVERPHWWRDSNWWLVIIAAGTALVISWQSFETHKAASSALEGARAAQRSIDIAILKERARIRVEVDRMQFIQSAGPWPGFKVLPSVLLHVYNSGATKAFPTDSKIEFIVDDKKRIGQLLNASEVAPTEEGPIHIQAQIFEEVRAETIWLLNTEQASASVSGAIGYMDVFENKRRTSFRYEWRSDFAAIGTDRIGDKVLYGQWQKCEEGNEAN